MSAEEALTEEGWDEGDTDGIAVPVPMETTQSQPLEDECHEEGSVAVRSVKVEAVEEEAARPVQTLPPQPKGGRGRGNHHPERLSIDTVVTRLTKEDGGEFPEGVTTKQLYAYSNALPKEQRPNNSKNHLQVLLSRGVDKGRLIRLAPSLYTTTRIAETSATMRRRIAQLKADDDARVANGEAPLLRRNEPMNIVVESLDLSSPPPETPPAAKTRRPDPQTPALERHDSNESSASSSRPQRKRTKKVMGPDFVAWSGKKEAKAEAREPKAKKAKATQPAAIPPTPPPALPAKPHPDEAHLPKCDICFQVRNGSGGAEELLVCGECEAKAHGSCLHYEEGLARRCLAERSWQCADCKTCLHCATSEDSEHLLFCDSCDRAAHMACCRPPLSEKPEGQWSCGECAAAALNPPRLKRKYERRKGREAEGTPDPSARAASRELQTSPDSGDSAAESDGEEGGRPRRQTEMLSLAHLDSLPTCNCATELVKDLEENERVVGGCEEALRWSVSDVTDYITGLGFPLEAMHFKEEGIDGAGLLLMRREDVVGPGLGLKLGPAVKIFRRLQALQDAVARLDEQPSDFL